MPVGVKKGLLGSGSPNLQMIFPMAEVVGLLQEGVGYLLREAGLALMNLVMEEEVRHLAGERYQHHPERRAHRWRKEHGYCVVDGQKVPIRRTWKKRSRSIVCRCRPSCVALWRARMSSSPPSPSWRRFCRNVKRWRAGDHIERWVGSGLLVAERQFRKVQGYRKIPALLTSMANAVSKKAVPEEVKVA
jgi:hypothetical protein